MFNNILGWLLIKSHYALEPTLDIIGNVPSSTNILILNGENDTQTPVQQSFLLQQRLTEVKHPDHTLITYPNLGHAFYPSSQWRTDIGPIQPYVLADFIYGLNLILDLQALVVLLILSHLLIQLCRLLPQTLLYIDNKSYRIVIIIIYPYILLL
jgi:hypothetical protein